MKHWWFWLLIAWFMVIAWNLGHAQIIACGMPPITAPGCHVGPCVCTSDGYCTYIINCR